MGLAEAPQDVHDTKPSLIAELKQLYLKSIRMRTNSRGKVFEYDHESLLSWGVLLATRGPIFFEKRVWIVVPNVILVAGLCAAFICAVLPHGAEMDVTRFTIVATYIRAFVAVVLGLFLQETLKRWWTSVSAFKRFLTAIKQLMYTLHAVGVRDELLIEVQRLSIASSFVLNHEVHLAQITEAPYEIREDRWFNHMDDMGGNGLLMQEEQDKLKKEFKTFFFKSDEQPLGVFSMMIWTWIGDVMSQVRMEPNVAPPMYVRLLLLCEDCIKQVDNLKTNLSVQIPFRYTHFLAWLVHIANLLAAICCGLALGSALNEVLLAKKEEIVARLHGSFQVIFMQVVILLVQPVLYQSVLVITHNLSYPFGEDESHMPTESFIEQMELDLTVMCESVESYHTMCVRAGRAAEHSDDADATDEEDDDEDACAP